MVRTLVPEQLDIGMTVRFVESPDRAQSASWITEKLIYLGPQIVRKKFENGR